MIVEMRTYTLKPGTVADFERNFAVGLPRREELSKLGALWHTEVGTHDQIVHIWPYASTAERDRCREEGYKIEGWPPDIREFVVEMESKILIPAPFSPPVEPRTVGPLFEIITETYWLGSIPHVVKAWSGAIEMRKKLSPLVGAWRSEIGPLNQWIHIWAYRDAAHLDHVRKEVKRLEAWPPKAESARVQSRRSILARSASFSPIQ
jgi:hypothetical protein